MVVIFLVFSFTLIFYNIDKLPAALLLIVQHAFGLQAFGAGMFGAILIAMQFGLARGIFANEAGLGSAPIAAAAAKTNEPCSSGSCNMTPDFHRFYDHLFHDWFSSSYDGHLRHSWS